MSIIGKAFMPKATVENVTLAEATAVYYAAKEGKRLAKKAAKHGKTIPQEAETYKFKFGNRETFARAAAETTIFANSEKEGYKPMTDAEIKAAQEALNGKYVDAEFKDVTEAPKAKKAAEAKKAEKATTEAKPETKETKSTTTEEKAEKKPETTDEKKSAEKSEKTIKAEVISKDGKSVIAPAVAKDMTAASGLTGASIVSKFTVNPKPDEKVPVNQMNGTAFVKSEKQKPIVMPPQNEGVLPIENVREFLKANPNIQPPVPMVSGNIKHKVKELKKNITFIDGYHKNVDEIEIDCMLNMVRGPWIRERMRQEGAVGLNNPQFTEVPLETYDTSGRFNYAFECPIKGTSKKVLVVLYQSVPAFNGGNWTNDIHVFVARKKQPQVAKPAAETADNQ